jgi:hypothetical protein
MTGKTEKTVLCPKHGNPLPLVKKGDKFVAICKCYTGLVKNRWLDQVVYSEPTPEARKKAEEKKKKEAEKKAKAAAKKKAEGKKGDSPPEGGNDESPPSDEN